MSTDLPTIHRRTLRQPFGAFSRALGAVTGSWRPMVPERFLARIERQVGTSDWGSLDIATPIELMAKDFEEKRPGGLGRIMLNASIQKAARNRLQLVHALRKDPVQDEMKLPPIVVVGLHRTGTTLLHHMLSGVPGHRFVPMYRLMSPVPSWTNKIEAHAAIETTRMVGPEFFDAHPISAMGPEECWTLLMMTSRVADYILHWHLPRYTEYLDSCDMVPAYKAYAEGVRFLERMEPGRLVMKGPAHLHALDALRAAQPKAVIVWTHRDPVKSVASFGTLSAVHRRSIYGSYDPMKIGEVTAERFALHANRATAARDKIGDDLVLDVPYAELIKDPMNVVRTACRMAGSPLDEAGEKAVEAAKNDISHRNRTPHRYSLEQWGLERKTVLKAFGPYLDRFAKESGIA